MESKPAPFYFTHDFKKRHFIFPNDIHLERIRRTDIRQVYVYLESLATGTDGKIPVNFSDKILLFAENIESLPIIDKNYKKQNFGNFCLKERNFAKEGESGEIYRRIPVFSPFFRLFILHIFFLSFFSSQFLKIRGITYCNGDPIGRFGILFKGVLPFEHYGLFGNNAFQPDLF